ncbi:hypothetical protein NGC36_17660 [Serratia rubidaea]|uniref:hypothetical protein n=1 Tax=Serratia rubidaea TaxID=61652 RepID=UPI002DBB1352|nr:hypothetical protein [Serratia rubidaea]MEB7587098.1 hypothetical protein [Serratia rubidaea]
MNSSIDEIIESVQKVKSNGGEQIDTDKLLEYLTSIKEHEPISHDFNLETVKATNLHKLERMKLLTAVSIENFKTVITAGANASRACMLINGGAAVALLAFMGNIWNKQTQIAAIAQIANGIIYFCIGVLLAATCTGFTYLSQFGYANIDMERDDHDKGFWGYFGLIFNVLAITSAIVSAILFGFGCFSAYNAIGSQFTST